MRRSLFWLSDDQWRRIAPRIHGELLKLGIEVAQSDSARGRFSADFIMNTAGCSIRQAQGADQARALPTRGIG